MTAKNEDLTLDDFKSYIVNNAVKLVKDKVISEDELLMPWSVLIGSPSCFLVVKRAQKKT